MASMELKELYTPIRDWWTSLDPKDKAVEQQVFAPRFSYNSCAMEDAAVTELLVAQVFTEGRVSEYTGDVSTIALVANHRDTLAIADVDIARGRNFDASVVRECHAAITRGTYSTNQLSDGERPGTYKLGDYLVPGAAEVGAASEEVPGLVDDLCAEISEALDGITPKRALTVAAYYHCTFEAIHPFADGSGLVGRVLMNSILLTGGHPPVVVYAADKQAYYQALEAFTRNGDLAPFKQFLMAECVKTWRKRATQQ